MTSPDWQQVKDLFVLCEHLSPAERDSRLAASEAPWEVKQEVVRLLGNLAQASLDFLKPPEMFRRLFPARGQILEPGDLLAGRFKVVRFIGAGGMGEVYEAEDQEVRE